VADRSFKCAAERECRQTLEQPAGDVIVVKVAVRPSNPWIYQGSSDLSLQARPLSNRQGNATVCPGDGAAGSSQRYIDLVEDSVHALWAEFPRKDSGG
jgi:hypothetical protein